MTPTCLCVLYQAKTTGYFLVLVPLTAFCVRCVIAAFQTRVTGELKEEVCEWIGRTTSEVQKHAVEICSQWHKGTRYFGCWLKFTFQCKHVAYYSSKSQHLYPLNSQEWVGFLMIAVLILITRWRIDLDAWYISWSSKIGILLGRKTIACMELQKKKKEITVTSCPDNGQSRITYCWQNDDLNSSEPFGRSISSFFQRLQQAWTGLPEISIRMWNEWLGLLSWGLISWVSRPATSTINFHYKYGHLHPLNLYDERHEPSCEIP